MMSFPNNKDGHPVCSACLAGITHSGTRLFTFGLVYPTHNGDEIDVYARDAQHARELAEMVALADYQPGWTRLEALPAGGSAGLVYR